MPLENNFTEEIKEEDEYLNQSDHPKPMHNQTLKTESHTQLLPAQTLSPSSDANQKVVFRNSSGSLRYQEKLMDSDLKQVGPSSNQYTVSGGDMIRKSSPGKLSIHAAIAP